MEKAALRRAILDAFDEEEWAFLENGGKEIPVSDFNRALLLRLRDEDRSFAGDADEALAAAMRERLTAYLARVWADAPKAHKYVIQSCLALAFLYELPLHPPETVHARTVVENGKTRRFCPMREEGADSVCRFCPAEPMAALEARWAERLAAAEAAWGGTSAHMQKEAYLAGFQEAGVIPAADLRFHEEVRRICEENRCRSYGTTWACPPAVGTPEECRARVLGFERLLLFSKAYPLSDSMDFEGVRDAMADFKTCSRELGRRLRSLPGRRLILSNEGCGRCRTCTWPEAPCRFPEDLQPAIEGFGFLVSELAAQAGIPYLSSGSSVNFFGAVLYDEAAYPAD
jgi:predicted metal-binding protein/uncharacterized protein (UPF0305 family)